MANIYCVKNRILKFYVPMSVFLWILMSSSFFLSTSCNDDDKKDTTTISTEIKYGVSLQFIDANSEGNLDNANVSGVTVSIIGNNADNVQTISGETDFEVAEGFLALKIVNIIPSEDNPVNFTVVASSSGYLTTSQPVHITDTGQQILVVRMVNLSNLPDGISVKQQDFELGTDGSLTDPVEIETPLTANKSEKGSIKFLAGTKFYDDNDNVIKGTITATLVHFDNRSVASLMSFPGGFTAFSVEDSLKASMNPVTMATAGFMTMDLKSGSTKVKYMTKSLEMKMYLNDTTHNPNNNDQAIQVGDEIPFWGYDETGKWKLLGNSKVKQDRQYNYYVYLYWYYPYNYWYYWWWGWNWWWWWCRPTYTIQVSSNILYGSYYDYYYYTEAVSNWYGIRWWGYQRLFNGNRIYTGWWSYPYQYINYRAYDLYPWWWWWRWPYRTYLGQTGWFNPCYGYTPILNIYQPLVGTLIDIDVKIYCPNKPYVNITPSGYVYYRDLSSPYYRSWQFLGYVNQGKLQTNKLVLNKPYEFGTWYSGNWHTYQYTFTSNTLHWSISLPNCYFCNHLPL